MRTRRNVIATIVMGAVSAVLLAGCSGTSISNNAPSASTGPLPTLTPSLYKGVELTVWGAETSGTGALSKAYSAFEKASGAKIDYQIIPSPYEQNLLTKWTTGERPDLMYWNPIASQVALINGGKTLQPLDKEEWSSSVPKNIAAVSGVVDGATHAAVFQLPSSVGVFYNKADFAKAGVTPPTGGWDSFVAVAKKLKAAGITPIDEVAGDQWPLQWITNMLLAEQTKAGWADDLNTKKTTFSESDVVDLYTKYKSLQTDGLLNSNVLTETFNGQLAAVYSGKSAMAAQISVAVGNWNSTYGADKVDKAIGFFPLSLKGNLLSWSPDQAGTLMAPITKDPKKEEASRQFLRFLFSKDYYPTFLKNADVAPALSGFESPTNLSALGKSVQTAFDSGQTEPQWDNFALAKPDIQIYLDDMLSGRKTPAAVGAAMDQQFQRTLKAQGVKGF